MGIWSLLFPSEEDRLRKARALIAKGRFSDARRGLVRCTTPEAEALYDKCSLALEKGERATMKKELAAKGFHGWKIEIAGAGAKRRAELEALIAEEIARAGVDLDVPEIDRDAVQAAVARAQRRAKRGGGQGMVKLVPVVPKGRQ